MILFLHANGYPPESYRPLLDRLQGREPLQALSLRPLHEGSAPQSLRSWAELADEVILEMDKRSLQGCLGLGHSLGAVVLLLVARKRPDLFRRIVLLDPVFLPLWVYLVGALMPVSWLERHAPLAKTALRRRGHWPDREGAHRQLRKRRVFHRIDDAGFDAMLDGMLAPDPDGGVRLRYPKAWEARIYATPTWPYTALLRVRTPLHILRGEHSDTISPFTWKAIRRLRPDADLREMAGAGHLLPFEQPAEVAGIVLSLLSD